MRWRIPSLGTRRVSPGLIASGERMRLLAMICLTLTPRREAIELSVSPSSTACSRRTNSSSCRSSTKRGSSTKEGSSIGGSSNDGASCGGASTIESGDSGGSGPPERSKIGIRITPSRMTITRRTRSLRIGFLSITAHQLEELLVVLSRLHLALDQLESGLWIVSFGQHLTQDPHAVQHLFF